MASMSLDYLKPRISTAIVFSMTVGIVRYRHIMTSTNEKGRITGDSNLQYSSRQEPVAEGLIHH